MSFVTFGAARFIILTVPIAMSVEQRSGDLCRNLCMNENFLNVPKKPQKNERVTFVCIVMSNDFELLLAIMGLLYFSIPPVRLKKV